MIVPVELHHDWDLQTKSIPHVSNKHTHRATRASSIHGTVLVGLQLGTIYETVSRFRKDVLGHISPQNVNWKPVYCVPELIKHFTTVKNRKNTHNHVYERTGRLQITFNADDKTSVSQPHLADLANKDAKVITRSG